jgi:hypothetical protein
VVLPLEELAEVEAAEDVVEDPAPSKLLTTLVLVAAVVPEEALPAEVTLAEFVPEECDPCLPPPPAWSAYTSPTVTLLEEATAGTEVDVAAEWLGKYAESEEAARQSPLEAARTRTERRSRSA